MAKRGDLLAEKRTHLAEIRTELAYKRTRSADLRTSLTMILFGVAFIGFSQLRWDFFFIAGLLAVGFGCLFLIIAAVGWAKHSREIKRIKVFFNKEISSMKRNGF
ncbi:MAG: DUF202 domain-containing protein [Nanoarchaeota archaeon]|nr:DUF202 domain-containing protein [Nanoarchaeota archaeon]